MIQIKAASLRAPHMPGMPKHPLARDIVVVIAAKFILVIAAAILVFGPDRRPKIDAESVGSRLVGMPTVSLQSRKPAP
jgi:hypothetical protein